MGAVTGIQYSPPTSDKRRFVTTRWQLVSAAGKENHDAIEHLDQLLRLYLPVLQEFLRARYRLSAETTEDVLQDFVANKIIRGGLIQSASPDKGRFRNLLLTSLTRHTTSVIRSINAAKRIPESAKVPWELLQDSLTDSAAASNEEHFNSSLNRAIIDHAIKRFQQHCERRRKLVMWEVFEGRLINPLLHELPAESYSRLVARLQLDSPQKASNLLMTAKRSFIKILENVIEDFALNAEDAQTELSILRRFCDFEQDQRSA